MPELKGWTISVENGGGTLSSGNKFIVFGKRAYAKDHTEGWYRIDISQTFHGQAEDVATVTVPRFMSAADLVHREVKNGGVVTMHCANGNSRTSFVLIVYLMRHEGFTWDEASQLISDGQTERPDIVFNINAGGHNGPYSTWVKEYSQNGKLMDRADSSYYIETFSQVRCEPKENKAVFEIMKTHRPKKMRAGEQERIDVFDGALGLLALGATQ
ncbi:dual specificity protein phosphatase-like protein [Luteibacter rhizovicinus]|uniref:Dual specificity protein phosphatase-like protein n=1 Tax=Luteibacter rhizovicinus TaxID=242606 RepID=A0A4R3YWN8_9GAMM|nr:dual specificity protein phosphatase family protein [Luteibacter rhizovicinus]TCV95844.1 dual specificity protein phosphatase-like protein [Luteibacter rhizovicinus]